MRWWTTGAGQFWAKAVPSLVLLLVAGACFHTSIVPPRIYWSDYLTAAPVILCCVLSVRARQEVDFWTRLSYGLMQAIILIMVFEDHWYYDFISGRVNEVLVTWVLLAGVYAVIFAGLTQVLSAQSAGQSRDPTQCRTCGYSLKGLTEPRCPECNTPFDPVLLGNDGPR